MQTTFSGYSSRKTMQKIAAIHDGGPQGWETLYLAFHLAARLASPLLVLTLPGGDDEPAPSLRGEKIRTGAAAAGIPVEIQPIPLLEPEAVLASAGELSTLLLPGARLAEPGRASLLAKALGCPIWAVTGRSEIRLLAALGLPPGDDAASRYTRQLAGRLGQPLLLLAAAAEAPDPAGDGVWEPLGELSLDRVEECVRLRGIDVLAFASADAALFEECSRALGCALVLCPPEPAQSA